MGLGGGDQTLGIAGVDIVSCEPSFKMMISMFCQVCARMLSMQRAMWFCAL